jgi:hypothetical protein
MMLGLDRALNFIQLTRIIGTSLTVIKVLIFFFSLGRLILFCLELVLFGLRVRIIAPRCDGLLKVRGVTRLTFLMLSLCDVQ